jgi:hypothetical protein
MGSTEKEFDKVLGMGEEGGYDESLEMDAFRIAVINLTKNIITTIDKTPWVCDVVKISNSKLYLDAGKKSNLTKGMVLDIIQKGESITNISGKVIGYEEKWLGTGTITDFFGIDGSVVVAKSDTVLSLPLFCRLSENEETLHRK